MAGHQEAEPWELSREDIIRFLQNRGSVSVLAEHKLLGNIYKMWPREVTKMLVLAYNHIFANKHFRGTVNKLDRVRSGRKQKAWCQVRGNSGWGVGVESSELTNICS